MTNKLQKVCNEFTVKEKEDNILFTITKKEEKVLIYDEELVNNLFDEKFNIKYKEILYLIMNINEEDDNSSDIAELALVKIDDLKNLVFNKYLKYLSKDKINRYLKKINLLEEKVIIPTKRRGR